MSAPLVSARAVRGVLRLRAELDASGKTVLADRHAAGAFHLSKPYWDGHALMVQWINPTAGIFAGDVLESDVRVGEGASLLLTTPSATRIHTRLHSATAPGNQRLYFHVATGGSLEIQPEWLIPQAMSAFSQKTTINLDEGSTLFFAEMLAPGRVARGEELAFDKLMLQTDVTMGKRLVLRDRLVVSSSADLWRLREANSRGLFMASVVVTAPCDAACLLKRELMDLPAANCEMGASYLHDAFFVFRITSRSPQAIRHLLTRIRSEFARHVAPLRASLRKL